MAELSQQQRDLTTVMHTMIGRVLQQLAQCHRPRVGPRIFERHQAMEILVLQRSRRRAVRPEEAMAMNNISALVRNRSARIEGRTAPRKLTSYRSGCIEQGMHVEVVSRGVVEDRGGSV